MALRLGEGRDEKGGIVYILVVFRRRLNVSIGRGGSL